MLSNSATHCHVQAHPPHARTSKQDISKHPSTWSNISSRPPLGTHSFQTITSTIDFSPVSAWKLPLLSASCLLQLANGMLQLPLSSSRLKRSTEEIQRLRHTDLHSMNSRSVSPIPVGSIAPSSGMSLQHQKHSHAIHSARPPLRLARRNIEFQFKVPHFLQVCDFWPGPHHDGKLQPIIMVKPSTSSSLSSRCCCRLHQVLATTIAFSSMTRECGHYVNPASRRSKVPAPCLLSLAE